MYVTWKRRALTTNRACEYCYDHRAVRYALIPHVVESRRSGGRPRQVHIARLPSIRSCCLPFEYLRSDWWRQVELALEALRGRGLTDSDLRAIRHKLQERVQSAAGDTGPRPPSYLAQQLAVLRLCWP